MIPADVRRTRASAASLLFRRRWINWREVRRRIDASGYDIRPGSGWRREAEQYRRSRAAGADMFVAGSAISISPTTKVIDEMRSELAL